MTCDQCAKRGVDKAAVIVEDAEYGFCSLACLVRFVRTRWIEAAA